MLLQNHCYDKGLNSSTYKEKNMKDWLKSTSPNSHIISGTCVKVNIWIMWNYYIQGDLVIPWPVGETEKIKITWMVKISPAFHLTGVENTDKASFRVIENIISPKEMLQNVLITPFFVFWYFLQSQNSFLWVMASFLLTEKLCSLKWNWLRIEHLTLVQRF